MNRRASGRCMGTSHIGPLFSATPPPRLEAIRGPDAKPGLGRFSPAGSLHPCPPPYLLPAVAAARGPLDPLSDKAAGARAGNFKLLLETISSALLWESVQFSLLSPCCLSLELSLGFCFPCCPILAHMCMCVCVCETEDSSVLTLLPSLLDSISFSPLLLTWEQPKSAGIPASQGPLISLRIIISTWSTESGNRYQNYILLL